MYYDKDGQPIDQSTWGRLFQNRDYKVIQQDVVNGQFISTVWLGINHAMSDERIAIFESMVFPEDSMSEEECVRYATESEALAGHQTLLEKYS